MAYPAYSTTDAWSDEWAAWRQQVVSTIRTEFPEVLPDIGEEDIDWETWRPFYDQGHSPRRAVDQAFLRDVTTP